MDYSQFSVEDFLLDDQFRKWIFNPEKDDNIYWENWLAQNPKKATELIEARNLLLNLSMKDYRLTVEETADLWDIIDAKSEMFDESLQETKIIPLNSNSVLKQPTLNRPNYQWLRIAAILLILVVGSVVLLKINSTNREELGGVAATMEEKITEMGMKAQITLSDGTIVMLNSGSKLSYLPHFSTNKRDVYLEGEAYFEVAKDSKRPFNVHTGEVTTTAIGTAFNVNSYQDGGEGILIALVEGKVRVKNKKYSGSDMGKDLILSPGDMANYNPHTKNVTVSKFDIQAITSWKDGSLYFTNSNESEVFNRIERWYGVSIQHNNSSSKKWDYSGEFKNQNLHQVLTSISFTMAFDYEIKNSNIYITYKNPKSF